MAYDKKTNDIKYLNKLGVLVVFVQYYSCQYH